MVSEIELDHGVSAGIDLRSLGAGLIPLVEEHETRAECRYSFDEWYSMDPIERAFCVAQRRIRIAMKNLQTEAEIKASKPRPKGA